ncbi:prepilin peptidase [Sulfurimonas lithotrophica]|uniref:Prepilin peptidase n=1 Tax=Sulfurimonas lithotrophica TaxID=2590022 RepID=A0A5P8P3Y3_9BACT|nr:prepilin peptidase [Sulfurimonas lithotrophica]
MEMILAFVFGIVFGSFLNVVILRIPNDESIVFISSHCYSCNNKLKPWHNIPIFSWIFLRGKCAYCQANISKQYPIIEFISGILFAVLVQKYSFSVPIIFIYLSFSMLLVLAMIDFKYKMIPDSINLLAIVFAILGAWNMEGFINNFQNALLFAGGFTLLRFSLSYILTSSAHRVANKTLTPWTKHYQRYPYIEAMGEGDIMVAATMGALLGTHLTLVAIFLSAVLALPVMVAVHNKSAEEQRVPFVPFLALATFIVYIFDTPIKSFIEANY